LPNMTTPVEQTEPKPETETPDDLSAALSKTSDAYAAIVTQIADLQATMRNRRERLDTLEVLVLEKSRLVAHLREQASEAETKLGYARTAAGVAKGTVAEKSTANNVKTLTAALAVLHQQLQEAHLQYSTQDTQARVETSTINKELEQDQAELETLEQTRSDLKQLKAEKKAELGQAIYAALADEMRGLLEAERKHEEALTEQRAQRLARQESIAERLADWPALASRLEEELTPLDEKKAPEPSPTMKVTKALLKYLDLIEKYGQQLEMTQQLSRIQVLQRISLPENFIAQVLLPQGRALIEQRRYEIEQYQRQVEEQERDRALYRELGLYGTSR
jgi:hypothetical protein